nr:hypothetical protein [Deltaproteobacteria bacterium]
MPRRGLRRGEAAPDNPFLRNTCVVKRRGRAFTVGPGCTSSTRTAPLRRRRSGGSTGRWSDALAPFGGIRIEDDVVVRRAIGRTTEIVNLTRGAPGGR